jgi:hypothetical protein
MSQSIEVFLYESSRGTVVDFLELASFHQLLLMLNIITFF